MRWRLALLMAAIGLAAPAQAAVSIAFYSREMGSYFPHAFIVASGHPDGDPRPADASYGFTATAISPAILAGPVKGAVEPVPVSYVAGSTRHFAVEVSNAQYARIRALIAQWQALRQPSYDLHRRNCVSFVAAVAREIGLHADDDARLVTKPRAYLARVRLANPVLGDGRTIVAAQSITGAGGTTPPAAPPPGLSAAAIAAGYRPTGNDR